MAVRQLTLILDAFVLQRRYIAIIGIKGNIQPSSRFDDDSTAFVSDSNRSSTDEQ